MLAGCGRAAVQKVAAVRGARGSGAPRAEVPSAAVDQRSSIQSTLTAAAAQTARQVP